MRDLPRPNAAKIARRPPATAQRTMARWKPKSTSDTSSPGSKPDDGAEARLLSKNSA